MEQEALKIGAIEKSMSPEAFQCLVSYSWPGNIRELENLIRYLLVTTEADYIELSDIPTHVRQDNHMAGAFSGSPGDEALWNSSARFFAGLKWAELENEYVKHLLEKNNWNITRAAADSGINRSTFASRMRKLNIRRGD